MLSLKQNFYDSELVLKSGCRGHIKIMVRPVLFLACLLRPQIAVGNGQHTPKRFYLSTNINLTILHQEADIGFLYEHSDRMKANYSDRTALTIIYADHLSY